MDLNIFNRLILLALIVFPSHLFAQVTIGLEEDPEKGALLQLKNIKGVTDESPNADRGLGVPRVNLTILRELTDVGNDLNKRDHTGLLVYNVNVDTCAMPDPIYAGLYVWNGDRWEYVGEDPSISSEVKSFVDPRDTTTYLYREFYYMDEANKRISAGEWMLENLAYKPNTSEANHGFPKLVGDFLEMTKHFMYPISTTEESVGYNPEEGRPLNWNKKLGVLYNWFAATQTSGSIAESDGGQQGICPPGWHLPTDDEWNKLEKALYNERREYSYFTNEPFYIDKWLHIWDLSGKELNDYIQELPDESPYLYYAERRGDGNAQYSSTEYGLGPIMLNYCDVKGMSYPALKGGFDVYPVGAGVVCQDGSEIKACEEGSVGASCNYAFYAQFWTSTATSIVTDDDDTVVASFYRTLYAKDMHVQGAEFVPYVSRFVSIYGYEGAYEGYKNYTFYNSVRCKKD